MMKFNLHLKNVSQEQKDKIEKLAEAKLEDLGHFFPKDLDEDSIQAHCSIEERSKNPFFRVHAQLTIKQGKSQFYEAEEEDDSFEKALNAVKDMLRSQISQKKS